MFVLPENVKQNSYLLEEKIALKLFRKLCNLNRTIPTDCDIISLIYNISMINYRTFH